MPFGQLAFDLLERPAKLVQSVLRNADAVVLDGDRGHAGARTATHRDGAAVRRELDGVRKEIERDLLECAAVGIERDAGRDLRIQRQAFFVGAAADNAQAVGEDVVEVDYLQG